MTSPVPKGHRYFLFVALGIVACRTSSPVSATIDRDRELSVVTSPAVKPRFSLKKGLFEMREYYQGSGLGHGARVWCELEINGQRYRPFDRDFYGCSLSPAPEPSAATLAVEGGAAAGLYLLRLVDGRPDLQKIDAAWSFNGFWTADGGTYIHGGRAFDIATGGIRKLPAFPGWFLCFSPDRRLIVSSKIALAAGAAGAIDVYQTDIATGAVATDAVPRTVGPWLADSTHTLPGTTESAHLWIAAHFKWKKDEHGHDRLDLPRSERGD